MSARTTERRCAAIVEKLDIPQPFDIAGFLDRLALQRDKKIYLHPFRSGPGMPCGLWISTADADHIFHEEGTSDYHKTHIVLHEVAHMLLGHDGTGAWDSMARLLAPDVDPALVRLVMGRTGYTSKEEREAETLASLILGRAARPVRKLAIGDGTGAMLCLLEQTWGNSRRSGQGSLVQHCA